MMDSARSQSWRAEAWGIPNSRCSGSGKKGCVDPVAGQVCSSAPRNQRAFASSPADSAGPVIWIGASLDSGVNNVSLRMRARDERNSFQGMRRPSNPNEAQRSNACSHRCHAWYSALDKARSPGIPAARRRSGTRAAQARGLCRTLPSVRWASRMPRSHLRERPSDSTRWLAKASSVHSGRARLRRRISLMYVCRSTDSSGPAPNNSVENSQSNSVSVSGPPSQRSSRCAARTSGTWPSGMPSENSKSGRPPGLVMRRKARSTSPLRPAMSCERTRRRASGFNSSCCMHHAAHAVSSDSPSMAL